MNYINKVLNSKLTVVDIRKDKILKANLEKDLANLIYEKHYSSNIFKDLSKQQISTITWHQIWKKYITLNKSNTWTNYLEKNYSNTIITELFLNKNKNLALGIVMVLASKIWTKLKENR